MSHGDKNAGSVFGLPQAGPKGETQDVFRNATTVAAMRVQYPRVADKAKSPLD